MSDWPREVFIGWIGSGQLWGPYNEETHPSNPKYIREDLTGLQCFYDYDGELPDKFIALYSDGSGCEMYFREGVNWYPAKDPDDCFGGVDKDWFIDAGYLWFIALPDDFKVWGETDDQN